MDRYCKAFATAVTSILNVAIPRPRASAKPAVAFLLIFNGMLRAKCRRAMKAGKIPDASPDAGTFIHETSALRVPGAVFIESGAAQYKLLSLPFPLRRLAKNYCTILSTN
jgi:hypothetical protein